MFTSTYKRTLGPLYNKTFWKQGFLLIPNYFTSNEGLTIKSFADRLDNINEEKGKWMIYYEKNSNGVKKRNRVENYLNYHDDMKDFISNRVTSTLNDIYQKDMILFKDKMNWKKAWGKGFQPHQDQPAWLDFPPKRFVTAALFGNKTNKNNGCLEFSKGNHSQGLFNYDMNNMGELNKEVEDKLEWEYVETTPRDLLIFDSFAPHRSKCNKTDKERRIFYFTYNPLEDGDYYEEYIERKRLELPPDIERDEGKEYKFKGSKYNLANPIE